MEIALALLFGELFIPEGEQSAAVAEKRQRLGQA
jgi:hypothetical protein